jgi:ribonuclease-3
VFTHASWVESRVASYERLEFLGDSVLSLAIAAHLYERFPDRAEGDLAKVRAHVVSRPSCASVARRMHLERDLAQEARRAGSDDAAVLASDSVMAAVIEAAIGAVFLEFGHERTAAAVVDAFAGRIVYALERHVDYKTVLQEELARQGASVTYRLVEASGPPHQRIFTSTAVVGDRELGRGSGASKKSSEQAAARLALERIDELH